MTNGIPQKTLGWFSIFRLGLVQACLGCSSRIDDFYFEPPNGSELSMAATVPGF